MVDESQRGFYSVVPFPDGYVSGGQMVGGVSNLPYVLVGKNPMYLAQIELVKDAIRRAERIRQAMRDNAPLNQDDVGIGFNGLVENLLTDYES